MKVIFNLKSVTLASTKICSNCFFSKEQFYYNFHEIKPLEQSQLCLSSNTPVYNSDAANCTKFKGLKIINYYKII